MKVAISKIYFFTALAVAVFVFGVTAYNSHGFYHADEHYQIIEYAGLKLGTHTPNEVAWEYKAQIRPGIQPALCYLILIASETVRITDAYQQAFLLRLLTAVFALFAIAFFVLNSQHLFKEEIHKRIYYFISFLLWFIPVISVRFSSETWAGLIFLILLAVWYGMPNNRITPWLLGVLAGLSFLFRFQMGFALLGFVLWLLIVNKSDWIYLLNIGASFIAVLLLGVWIDYWFYGEWVFAPWNYLATVVGSAGGGFGISPWYYYFVQFINAPIWPLGLVVAFIFIVFLYTNPKALAVWCIIPFILAHTFVPHKELRFLFPLVFLFPYVVIQGCIFLSQKYSSSIYRVISIFILCLLFLINGVGLFAMGQKSAGIGRMEITCHIHRHYGDSEIHLIFCSWANPYNPWHGTPMKFYDEAYMSSVQIRNLCELNDSLLDDEAVNLLVCRKADLQDVTCADLLQKSNFVFELQSIPVWIEKLNKYYKGFPNKEILQLYRYDEEKN